MNADDYINYNGWEFSARMAFCMMNEYKDVYADLSPDKKVKLAHQFYDLPFRCNDIPVVWQSENVVNGQKATADHPFSARVAHRAFMNENQHFLGDFDLFKPEFYKLLQRINMTSQENSDVKIKSDGNGDVIVPQYITERYSQVGFFENKVTGEKCYGFPLEVPQWYGKYEEAKLLKPISGKTNRGFKPPTLIPPANLEKFFV